VLEFYTQVNLCPIEPFVLFLVNLESVVSRRAEDAFEPRSFIMQASPIIIEALFRFRNFTLEGG
jgi:hypothetical protein